MHCGLFLFRKSRNLLFGKPAHSKMIEQPLYRVLLIFQNRRLRTPDQYCNAIDVELLEALAEFVCGSTLDILTMRQQVEHV